MFPAFILGISLLAGFLLAGRWYATADTKTLLTALKWALLGTVLAVVVFFVISGRIAWAFATLPALLPWFYRIRAVARAAKTFSRMRQAYGSGGSAAGETSDLETRFLRMQLDHGTGNMSGVVIAGPFEGQKLDGMSVSDLVQLWTFCDAEDAESARVVAAYLDRAHPDWRDHGGAGGEDEAPRAASGIMDRAEALQVLGLADGATRDDIKDAHRRLIAGMHPDHGGSDYLAAQINQAKDVLLGE